MIFFVNEAPDDFVLASVFVVVVCSFEGNERDASQ